jgi:hypothetical protein
MKVLFVGPSLARADCFHRSPFGSSGGRVALFVRGPAQQGDLLRAVSDGASVIGLIDGLYDAVAAVWHKEILFALSEGVQVFGAASMGAMRAAECAAFGMAGVGQIYQRYASGELDDDAAVAQTHAPAELGYMPLTEALVNVQATIAAILADGFVSPFEAAQLSAVAARQHFKDRTYASMVATLPVSEQRRAEISAAIAANKRDIKRDDAEELVRVVTAAPDSRGPAPVWELSRTLLLQQLIQETIRGAAEPVRAGQSSP